MMFRACLRWWRSILPSKVDASKMTGMVTAVIGRLAGGQSSVLNAAGYHVLGVANQQVPHETGDLMRSGGVSTDNDSAAIFYDTPYAVVQHEDMGLRHDEGRNAKYLENAVRSEEQVVMTMLQAGLKGIIGS